MTSVPTQADASQVTTLLTRWIKRHVDDEGLAWLNTKRTAIEEGASDWVFFTSFSAVPRYLGKDDLELTPEDLVEAEAVRAGWKPGHWSVDQAGRTILLAVLPPEDADSYFEALEKVFTSADVGESVALYQSLPLLPYPERHRDRAAEGIRSNMTSVFNAVALQNPYPADYLEEGAWNQMVLKAVFVGSPLYLIEGLDRRANPALARMLVDFVHERWAAGRSITPEVWRLVGPYAEGDVLDDLQRVLDGSDPVGREAAALALSQSPDAGAEALLDEHPMLKRSIESRRLTWDSFSADRLGSADG